MELVSDVMIPSASALLGAGVGWWASRSAARAAIQAQKDRDEENEKSEVRAMLQAISDELSTLVDIHTGSTGAAQIIEGAPSDTPIAFFYPISSHYFTVFDACGEKIGRVPDPEIRRCVVATYIHFKSFIDTIRLNNEFSRQLELAELNALQHAGNPALLQIVDIHKAQMVEYAPALKASHARAMLSYQQLMHALRAYDPYTTD